MWLRSLGIANESRLAEVMPLRAEEIAGFSIESDTGFGPMRHLRPPVTLDETPARWKRPVVPLGTHAPSWPD
jgi:hypothetical protein